MLGQLAPRCRAHLPKHSGTQGLPILSPNSKALIPHPNFLKFGQRISERNLIPLDNDSPPTKTRKKKKKKRKRKEKTQLLAYRSIMRPTKSFACPFWEEEGRINAHPCCFFQPKWLQDCLVRPSSAAREFFTWVSFILWSKEEINQF